AGHRPARAERDGDPVSVAREPAAPALSRHFFAAGGTWLAENTCTMSIETFEPLVVRKWGGARGMMIRSAVVCSDIVWPHARGPGSPRSGSGGSLAVRATGGAAGALGPVAARDTATPPSASAAPASVPRANERR